jgi:hypothetical protein
LAGIRNTYQSPLDIRVEGCYITYINERHAMSSNSSSSSSGIGFPGLLTVLFIGLKLTGHITWPWVWVLSPLWISALIALAFLVIFIVLAVIAGK